MNLALVLADENDLAGARNGFAAIVQEMHGLLGPDHPDSLRCEGNLLLARRKQESRRYESELSDVIRRLVASLGEEHPAVEALRESRYLHRTLDLHPF
jgi:hypothetical protein